MRLDSKTSSSPDFAADFAPGLIDPASATPFDVVGPRGRAAVHRRYDVYRNNVTVGLIDALAATYPAVQRIVGTEFFRGMARLHVRATPPASPLLFEYGRDFPAFIEGFEHTQDLPWLADVARIERAWLDAYHAADLPPLSADELAGIAPERLAALVFTPHPTTRIVRSPFPVVTIFAANRIEGPVTPIRSDAAQHALITRPGMDVVVRLLPSGGSIFLAELARGESLGAAATVASAHAPAFDLSLNIAGMMEAGAFTSIHHGDRP
jgi:putative DNA-binding protein